MMNRWLFDNNNIMASENQVLVLVTRVGTYISYEVFKNDTF